MKIMVNNVESLGSGITRILRAYGEDCFKFTDNFIRITLPISAHDSAHDGLSVSRLNKVCTQSEPSRHPVDV